MTTKLADFMDEQFKLARRDETTSKDRAMFFEIDAASYSKILTGTLTLTPARAGKWAEALFPKDKVYQAQFVRMALEAVRVPRYPSVSEFCDSIVEEGGSVPVERIAELFAALQAADIQNPLICVEYRDVPRAGPDLKYHDLGIPLVEAIANRVSFAMFQPFLTNEPKAGGQQRAIQYMVKIRDECRLAYRTFRKAALEKTTDVEIDKRLRLYERRDLHHGTGFQAKLFFMQYQTMQFTRKVDHHRILQWVTTPRQDLLVYRGELNIEPTALKESFYPVVQHFDANPGELPRQWEAGTPQDRDNPWNPYQDSI
jgi:hypothetical protein